MFQVKIKLPFHINYVVISLEIVDPIVPAFKIEFKFFKVIKRIEIMLPEKISVTNMHS